MAEHTPEQFAEGEQWCRLAIYVSEHPEHELAVDPALVERARELLPRLVELRS